MLRLALLALSLSFAIPTTAEVYRCEQNGNTTFSDAPCGKDAENLGDVEAPKPGGSMGSGLTNEFFDERSNERGLKRIENEIDDLEDRRAKMRQAMQAELNQVTRKRRLANNNLAGAVWENSLAKDKEAIQQKWRSRIQDVNDEIKRYHQKRRELQNR